MVEWWKHPLYWSFKRKYANDMSQYLGCRPRQRKICRIWLLPSWNWWCTKHWYWVQKLSNKIFMCISNIIMKLWIVKSIFNILMLGFLDLWHHHLLTFRTCVFIPIYLGLWTSFFTEDVDYGHVTKDCGVEVEFDQSSCDILYD